MGRKRRAKKTHKPQEIKDVSGERLVEELQRLVEKRRYREALKKLKEIRLGYPELKISEKEENLWLEKGKQEWLEEKYEEGQKSFRKSVELGLNGEGHYWWAKSLLSLEKREQALEVMKEGYEKKLLGKEYGGCYLKLLCLQRETEKVEELIKKEPERFTLEQKQWAKGMVAVLKGEEEKAAENWTKMDKKGSPEDCPWAWMIYLEQKRENWLEAQKKLNEIGEQENRSQGSKGIEQKLLVRQGMGTGESLREKVKQLKGKMAHREEIMVLEMLNLIEKKKWREAGEIAAIIGKKREEFPEIEKIYRGVLLEAGEEAWREGEVEWTIEKWWQMVEDKPLEPQFLVRLNQGLRETRNHRRSQRVLNKLLNWLKKEGKKESREWPQQKRKETLAKLYCYLADSCMGEGLREEGLKNLTRAEELCAELPDVVGRKGLRAAKIEGKTEESIPMLRQAIEEGCDCQAVYESLVEGLEEIGDREEKQEVRRRFGQRFGDKGADLELSLPLWEEALWERSYLRFERKIKQARLKKPEMEACRIFVAETREEKKGEQVNLRLESAQEKWEELLKGLNPFEQIGVIETIAVSLVRYGKRQKGRGSLIDYYAQKLWEYAQEFEKARKAHLVLLIVKGLKIEKWQNYLRQYLRKTPSPDKALGELQLKVRRWGNGSALMGLIEEALSNNPQNPLLILALATGFSPETQDYQKLSEQGFELARRLQDKQSLKAWREEEAFVIAQQLREVLENLILEKGYPSLEEILEKLKTEVFKRDLLPEDMDRIFSELKTIISSNNL